MTLRDAPQIARSEVSDQISSGQRVALKDDPGFGALDQLVLDYGFTHWSYVAAPTCAPDRRLGEALRVTTYPREHVQSCERHGLYRSVPSLDHAFRSSQPTHYGVVRDSAPKSKGLEAFSALNQRFGLTRGMLVPLTHVVGVRAALGLAFDGSDRELEAFWHDRREPILAEADRIHRAIQSRHLRTFSSALIPDLSTRKRDVLRALAGGCTTTEVADSLGIAVFTVDKHIADLKRILRARTTPQLTALAIQHGLLEPGQS